jgi:NTE family protein
MGLDEGRRLYPQFKHLADSLNQLYGPLDLVKDRLPKVNKVQISSYEVQGVEKTSADFFVHTMDFVAGKSYTAKQLANMVRRAVGTRYYSRIVYSLQPQPDSTSKIVFDVTENPLTFAKLGLHYNRFTGIGVIANITSRNFFTTNSRSLITVNLGESFRVRAEHLQYLGRLKNVAIPLDLQFDRFDFTTYDRYIQDGLYKQHYFRMGGKLQFSAGRNLSIGLGHKFEWLRYSPTISKGLEFKGSNNFTTTFGYIEHNSLDRSIYPHKGVKFQAEAGAVARQHPNIRFLIDGAEIINEDSIQVSTAPYLRTTLTVESYIPLSKRCTFQLGAQGGINFDYNGNVMNEFIIGGLTKTFRNQITFAGLPEGSLYTPAMATLEGGLRVQIFNNTYVTGRANVLFNNFISQSSFFANPDFLSGYAMTFSYNFALGPLEISAMYCDQTRKFQSYINLGIPF